MDFEVTVVGAGVVGSFLACLLAQNGISVCLLDRRNTFNTSISSRYQGRTFAINLSSINLLKKLELWSIIKKEGTPFNRIYVWDSKGTTPLEFLAEEIDQEELGYVFSTNSILTSLNKILRSSKKISLELNKELSSIQVKEKLATISFADGKSISSRLLVGADGINSTLRKLANIKTRTWSYNQIAYFALLKTEKFHSNTAWQTFTPTGPIAFLPFDIKGKPNISLVWSAEKTFASELQLLQDKEFINKLEEETEFILGKITLEDKIQSFPLNQLHAKSYFSNRVVLVGDAAHSLHPLAGQGLNLGLADVMSLSDKIIKARRKGKDFGSKEILLNYERSRKNHNLSMTALMEVFKHGFENSSPWLNISRNLAFKIASENKWLKKRFIRKAAGIM